MHSHFSSYVHGLPDKHIISSKNFIAQATDLIGMLGRIFNAYPVDGDVDFFESKWWTPLLRNFHAFIMSIENFNPEDKLAQAPLDLLHSLITKMTKISCTELLDEKGEILESIIEVFTEENHPPENHLRVMLRSQDKEYKSEAISQILFSYYSQLLALAILEKWKKNTVSVSQFIEKRITSQELTLEYEKKIKASGLCLQAWRAAEAEAKRLNPPTFINKMAAKVKTSINNLRKIKPEDPIVTLVNKLMEEANWTAITSAAQTGSSLNVHDVFIDKIREFYVANATADFKKPAVISVFYQFISKKINEIATAEFDFRIEQIRGFFTLHLAQETNASKSLENAANDYALYGRPLKITFNNKTLNSMGRYSFGKNTKEILLITFGNFMTSRDRDERLRLLNNFVIKIIFYVFANLCTPEGQLKLEALESNEDPSNPDLKQKLCSKMVSKLVSSVVFRYLSIVDSQKNYLLYSNLNEINGALESIKARLISGAQPEFLERVRGFPFIAEPRLPAETFALSVTLKLNKKTIVLKNTLYDMKRMISDLEQESKYRDVSLSKVTTCIQTAENIGKALAQHRDIFIIIFNLDVLDKKLNEGKIVLPRMREDIKRCYERLENLKIQLLLYSSVAQFDKASLTTIIEDTKTQISTMVANAERSVSQLNRLVNPLLTARNAALPFHNVILSDLKTILNHEEYWNRRVYAGGGKSLSHLKVPTSVAPLARFLNANHKLDSDMYVHELLKFYDEIKLSRLHSMTGFFYPVKRKIHQLIQSSDTREMYAIIDELCQLRDGADFLDKPKLQKISNKLATFKKKQLREILPQEPQQVATYRRQLS